MASTTTNEWFSLLPYYHTTKMASTSNHTTIEWFSLPYYLAMGHEQKSHIDHPDSSTSWVSWDVNSGDGTLSPQPYQPVKMGDEARHVERRNNS